MKQQKRWTGELLSIFFKSDKEKKQAALFILVLAVMVGAVFFQGRNFDFIGVDDNKYIVKNANVNTGLSLDNIKWAFNVGYASNWHPLAWISHMIDVEIFGLDAGGHRMTSMLFHFLSSVLVFLLLKLATGKFWQSVFVSAIFAIHPLRAESVSFVAERKDVLSLFFGLISFIFYVLYSRSKNQKYYLATAAFFALSLLSKPMLVTLPIIFLLFDYWPLNRISENIFKDKSAKEILTEKIPLFLMSLGVSIITVIAQKNALIDPVKLTISERFENAFLSYLKYIGKFFWPSDLAFPYPHTWIDSGSGFKMFLVFSVFAGITVSFFWLKKYRYLLSGWLWYVLALLPVIGLVQVGSQMMADRFTYFPQIGLTILVVWGISDLANKMEISQKYSAALGIIFIAALLPVSIRQVSYWKDVTTLFNHSIAVTKNNSMAHDALCVHYAINGDLEDGIKHCNESLKLWIDDPYSTENKHNILFLAKERFVVSSDEEIKNADFIDAIGLMHERGHDFNQEQDNFKSFISTLARSEYDLGIRYIELGRKDLAEEALKNAIKLNPRYTEALTDLGVLKIGQEKPEDSIEYFSKALDVSPEYLSALYHWGVALRLTGDFEGAREKIEKVLSIKPGFPPAVAEYKKLDAIEAESNDKTKDSNEEVREETKNENTTVQD